MLILCYFDFSLLFEFFISIAILGHCVYMKRITLCNCLYYFSPSSGDSASIIRNMGAFGAKNYFADNQTANTIHCFRDSVTVLKYAAAIRFRKNFPFPSKGYKARTACWCKQPTSNSFQTLQTVYNYSNCTINQFLYCWQMF